jgi:hypothetical protein
MIEIVDGWTEWAQPHVDVTVTRIAWIDLSTIHRDRLGGHEVASATVLLVRVHPQQDRAGMTFIRQTHYERARPGAAGGDWVPLGAPFADRVFANLSPEGEIEIEPAQLAMLDMREYNLLEAMAARYIELTR